MKKLNSELLGNNRWRLISYKAMRGVNIKHPETVRDGESDRNAAADKDRSPCACPQTRQHKGPEGRPPQRHQDVHPEC